LKRASLLISSIIAILVITANIVALATIPVTLVATSGPSLDVIKDRVQKAYYDYIIHLERWLSAYYAVVSEYPALPIVVIDRSDYIYWVPGIKYYMTPIDRFFVEIRDEEIAVGNDVTVYYWYMDLKYEYYDGISKYVETWATLQVQEYRHRTGEDYVVIYVDYVKYDEIKDADIHVAGDIIGKLEQGNEYTVSIPKEPIPSMRTSVRHVDIFGAPTLSNLAGTSTDWEKLWNLGQAIMFIIFETDKPLYDIYNSMLQGFDYTGEIDEPNELHFYDAHWFDDGLGYYQIWDFFEEEGWIWTLYPAYPYKSRLVTLAEATGLNGGTIFLSMLETLDDPLYWTWWGLYYTYIGDYSKAKSIWNEKIAPKWDGEGLVVSGQEGYSTVRLAAAIALGSILAGKGYISWDTVDEMANVLVQLQWSGEGWYSPDGETFYKVIKPDHYGGFIVSYKEVASYGYTAFRPSLIEDILSSYEPMPGEYGGIIPTNTETTIVALAALMQYAYWKYGVEPSELLS